MRFAAGRVQVGTVLTVDGHGEGQAMKRLVLCCDGTWNSADQKSTEPSPNKGPDDVASIQLIPTNVVKLAYRIAKRDGDTPQLIFYDQGVGTGNALDRFLGGAFGDGLVDNIYDAYRFLIANYEAGDELFVFGFSRGAYTARSICGMVRKCGILDRRSVGQYVNALTLYRNPDVGPDDAEAVRFRTEHSLAKEHDIKVRFLGVWDTVGALGIPMRGLRWITRRKHQFHDTELSAAVQHAFHALAIDEHRAPFEPTLWKYKPKPDQKVEQVWFAGVHSDIGGGYREVGLSDIALRWMMDMSAERGLVFGGSLDEKTEITGDFGGTLHDSKGGLYRITPGIDRAIGVVPPEEGEEVTASTPLDPSQSVHPTVLQRWDADATYRPKALREYFRRINDPRGAGAGKG